MNKLIAMPGNLDKVFFLNEIDTINKHFDQVVVISYPGDKKIYEEISKKYKFKYYIVPKFSIKALINLSTLRTIFSRHIIREVFYLIKERRKVVSRLAYMVHYILFMINGRRLVEKEIKNSPESNICLYSYWLSRGGYLVATFNRNRGRYKNLKLILSRAHGFDLYEERNNKKYLPFRTYINNNLDEIHFISEDGMNYFKGKHKGGARKTITRLGTRRYIKSRNKKITDKKTLSIASCSTIGRVKRLDIIIDFLSSLETPFLWIHLGSGQEKFQRQVEEYAANKLKDKSYKFIGQVSNAEVLDIYDKYQVDYFINMSDSEGVPVSMMEAMSMGIPVIARNVGGISEILSNDKGILLDDISDREKTYQQINEFIKTSSKDDNLYSSLQEECIKTWERDYNAERNYDEFFKAIVNKIAN